MSNSSLKVLHTPNEGISKGSTLDTLHSTVSIGKVALDESAVELDPFEFSSLSSPAPGRSRKLSELSKMTTVGYSQLEDQLQNKTAVEIPSLSPYLADRSRRRSSAVGAVSLSASVLDTPTKEDVPVSGISNSTDVPLSSLHFVDNIRPEISASLAAKHRRRGRLHFAALCWCLFLEGWNDGTTGPLLPAIQRYYSIGFAVVSMLFVLNCVGFLTGAFMNVWLNDKLGFGKVIALGAVCQTITYAAQAPGGPFPVMVVANGVGGFGMALQNAQASGFVGSLGEKASTMFGFLYASYGVGALASPLLATYFSHVRHWSFHYLVSMGLSLSNTIALVAVFRFKTQDDVFAEAGRAPEEADSAGRNKYRQIWGIKAVHFLAFFALVYVGVEVTIGGWIVTFIIRQRDGGTSAGYISSGFFGGLTLGRIGLMWLNRLVGERQMLFIYALLAIGLEITIWVVPSMIGNGVAVSFIGLFLGPMYPILINQATVVLPRWLMTGSIGWIAGFGQAGSAVVPFLTGLLASRYGIGSLQPLLVAMMGTMVVVWACVPKAQPRAD